MFDWIKQTFADVRFEWRFQRHEREMRDRHRLEAERRFSADELRREIESLDKAIEVDADHEFNGALRAAAAKIDTCVRELNELERQLALFNRHYKDELSALFDRLNSIKAELNDLHERKQDATRRKDNAKASINAWYAKSQRSFFGNKGKPLPKRAVFGQSFGDLDWYKAARDSASREIVSCAKEIGELMERKRRIGEEIGAAKAARTEMYALKKEGVTRKGLSDAISKRRQNMLELGDEKRAIQQRRKIFVRAARHQYGVVSREATADQLDADKTKFLEAFDTRLAHLRRRAEYRRELGRV